LFEVPPVASMASISTVDWVLLAVLVLSLLVGLWRGLVFEVLSVLGWVAAFFLAQWFAPDVAALLPMSSASQSIRYAAAFVLTFIVAVFVAGLLASIVRKMVAAVGLRPVDRLLGGVFGLVRGLVLLLAVAVAISMTPLQGSLWWKESTGAPVLSAALKGLKPALPEQFSRFLN
jgi:membrane protein required for colicin V production